MEAEEQLCDLKEQVEQEVTKRSIETSIRQQREEQALSLQERYAQLVHYLQEAEEKRSAFEDGLREAQSSAQKAQALLQIKEVEIAYAKHYMETQDAQMLVSPLSQRSRCLGRCSARHPYSVSLCLIEKSDASVLHGHKF